MSDANQNIGKLTITADSWTSQKAGSTDIAEVGLQSVTLGCTLSNVTGTVLGLEADDGVVATGSCVSNLVTFSFTGTFTDSVQILTPTESETFLVRAVDLEYGENASISLSFNESVSGQELVYSEFEDTTCTTNACVDGGLRLGSSNFGSASATNN